MRDALETPGVVFNIQHYSIHDGPGIRTTVFLNGCPLRCLWCQNPESQSPRPQLFFAAEKCTGCGRCVEVCPEGAISIVNGRSHTDRELCNGAGRCTEVCPNEARNLMGKHVTAGEVFKAVAADAVFYRQSGGGVTLSGGDPVAQPRFAASLLELCREAAIHTAIETCGYASWDSLRRVLEHVDLVLYDFKHMDPTEHRRHTGVSNQVILENACRIVHELGLPLLARVPVIPGYNDSTENIAATARFIAAELGDAVGVNLLPYHRLGETKYERLEAPERARAIQPPTEARMAELRDLVASHGLRVQVGG